SCSTGSVPVQWSRNFKNVVAALMSSAADYFRDSNGTHAAVRYIRFGMGIGGENTPNNSLDVGTKGPWPCQDDRTRQGFVTNGQTVPWPAARTPAWQSNVAPVWIAHVEELSDHLHALDWGGKTISFSLSLIDNSLTGSDYTTPDAL